MTAGSRSLQDPGNTSSVSRSRERHRTAPPVSLCVVVSCAPPRGWSKNNDTDDRRSGAPARGSGHRPADVMRVMVRRSRDAAVAERRESGASTAYRTTRLSAAACVGSSCLLRLQSCWEQKLSSAFESALSRVFVLSSPRAFQRCIDHGLRHSGCHVTSDPLVRVRP